MHFSLLYTCPHNFRGLSWYRLLLEINIDGSELLFFTSLILLGEQEHMESGILLVALIATFAAIHLSQAEDQEGMCLRFVENFRGRKSTIT